MNRIRSVLAKTPRSSNHIQDCQEWLSVARSAAIAMQGLAEVQGDYVTIQQAQERFDKDLTPLQMELARGSVTENEQDPLFYRQVDLEQQGMYDTEALLQSSHALLLESQAYVTNLCCCLLFGCTIYITLSHTHTHTHSLIFTLLFSPALSLIQNILV